MGVVDTESYDSWLSFLCKVRGRGVSRVRLVTSDAHEGLRRAISEEFQGAASRRCVARLVRDCCREAGSRQPWKRVARIASAAFRLRDPAVVRAAYHVACEMLAECCPGAARVMEEAEPDALAYLDFPPSHWKRLRTNNLQERTNREIKRRSRVVQAFPSEKSLERLVGAVLCDVDEEWGAAALLLGGKDGRALRRQACAGTLGERGRVRAEDDREAGHRGRPEACRRDGGRVG